MNRLILQVMGLIVTQLFFYKDGYGIKLPTKVDVIKLRKQTKSQIVDSTICYEVITH